MNKNYASHRWVVVTDSYEKAEALIIAIEWSTNKDILRRVRSKHVLFTEFTDGTLLSWVNSTMSSRGKIFGRMWCDRNIDKNTFEQVIIPMYRGKMEDISWI